MNKVILIAVLFSLVSCTVIEKKKHSAPKEIEIKINTTIETFMILRSLSDSDPLFKYRKSDYKGKPLMYEARQYFTSYKKHEAVKETQRLLEATDGSGSMILQGLLYYGELPNPVKTYNIQSVDWKNKEDSLDNYISVLNQFYKEANVQKFMEENEVFYNGAIEEAKGYLNKNLVPALESYFGVANKEYKLILIPNSPFGMGFGLNVGNGNDRILYQILSPANDIEWCNDISKYETFGYSGGNALEYYRDRVVHEYCHSFITPFLEEEEWKSKINETDSLFVQSLNSIMSKQGYPSWWGFVNEHLVRLCEIRVSEKLGVNDINNMRKCYIAERGFILIPDGEKLMLEYEGNRKKHPTIESFLPELIDQLNKYSKEDIKQKMAAANKS